MYKTSQNLKNDIVKSMYDYLQINYKDIYFFMGKAQTWGPSDNIIPLDETKDQTYNIYKDLILLYRLNPSNISLGFNRINWESRVFPMYSKEDVNIDIHVITDDYSIYKCIDNNNSSISLNMPIHRSFRIPTEADGYKWKYLYTLSEKDITMFLSDTKIPIQYYDNGTTNKIITELNAIPGTIDSYKIKSMGSGYTYATAIINGDGTEAEIKLTVNKNTNTLELPTVINSGKNYTWATVDILTDGTDIEIEPIISPKLGHGSNLLKELNADCVIISNYTASKSQDAYNIPKFFDYRKVGLLSNVQDNNNMNASSISNCYKLKVFNSDNFANGDRITINNITGTLVSKVTTFAEHVFFINDLESHIPQESFDKATVKSLENNTETSVLACEYIPDINDSFNILHLEHISKKQRYEYTLDIIKIIIDF